MTTSTSGVILTPVRFVLSPLVSLLWLTDAFPSAIPFEKHNYLSNDASRRTNQVRSHRLAVAPSGSR